MDFTRGLSRLVIGRASPMPLRPRAVRPVVPLVAMLPPLRLLGGRNIRPWSCPRRGRSIRVANVLRGIRRRRHPVKVARRAGRPDTIILPTPLKAPVRLCTHRTAVDPSLLPQMLRRGTRRRLWPKGCTVCWPMPIPVVAWPTAVAGRPWNVSGSDSPRAQPDRLPPMRRLVVLRLRISRRRSTRSRAWWRLGHRRRRRWRRRSTPAPAIATATLVRVLLHMKGNIRNLGYRRWL